jgi:glucose-1-phosphate thymidylyltransferase
MKGVILAGGTGVRLRPLTDVTNKHLLPVYDEPMIYKVIKTLTSSGVVEILIVVDKECASEFEDLLGTGEGFNAKFQFAYQNGPRGIADALKYAEEFGGNDELMVILADNIFEDNFSKYINMFQQDENTDCYLFLKEVSTPEEFGIAELDNNDKIINIEEKPKKPKSNLAVTGLYFYRPIVFKYIREVIDTVGNSGRNELEITDVNNIFVENNSVKAFGISGFWVDAGTFDSLLVASKFASGQ